MMLWKRGRTSSAARDVAARLYAAAEAQARTPALYGVMGAPDTVEGRFELLTLHIILLLERLKPAPVLRQDLFDTYVSNLDGALREMGVGDLAMAKRMKDLGARFYGRAQAYEIASSALPDEGPLGELLGRTTLADRPDGSIVALVGYVVRIRAGLANNAIEGLATGVVDWAEAS